MHAYLHHNGLKSLDYTGPELSTCRSHARYTVDDRMSWICICNHAGLIVISAYLWNWETWTVVVKNYMRKLARLFWRGWHESALQKARLHVLCAMCGQTEGGEKCNEGDMMCLYLWLALAMKNTKWRHRCGFCSWTYPFLLLTCNELFKLCDDSGWCVAQSVKLKHRGVGQRPFMMENGPLGIHCWYVVSLYGNWCPMVQRENEVQDNYRFRSLAVQWYGQSR